MNTVIALLMILLFQAAALGQSYTFRSLPHVENEDPNSAEGRSVTNDGTILMNYIFMGEYYRTIKILPDGTVVPVKIPPSGFAMNLSNTGEIGGTSFDKNCGKWGDSTHPHPARHNFCDGARGFLIRKNGSVRTYDIPGKWIGGSGELNDYSHRVVAVRDKVNTNWFSGMLLVDQNDRHNILLDYPGAVWTDAYGINNADDVVGAWSSDGTDELGYLWSKGQFYRIEVPGSAGTLPTCINNAGDIGGFYWNNSYEPYDYHAFVYSHGNFTTVDYPVADGVERIWTDIGGLNDRGDIAGTYLIRNPPLLNGVERFAFVATAN